MITSKDFIKIRISKSKQTKVFEIWIFKYFSVITSDVDFIKKVPIWVDQSKYQYLSICKEDRRFQDQGQCGLKR